MAHITNFNINTNKITRDRRILSLSDFHLTGDKGFEHLKEIKSKTDMTKISHIVMPGDIVNDVNELKDNKFRDSVLQALSDFAEDKHVFLSAGNHDQMTLNNKKWQRGDYSLLQETIKQLPKFHLLKNGERITVNDITYSAFSPDYSYYEDEDKERKDLEAESDYEEAFMKNYNANLFDNNTFNILLTHEPQSIIKLSTKKGSCIQDNTDLVLSGHMHDGMLPHFFKRFCGNIGIISPQMQLLPKYAHGTVEVGDTTFVINGPVNARVESALINEIYGSNATVVDLVKTKRR